MAYVTIRDVAQRAGVSIAAVSQILHGKGRFSEETRRLVRETVTEMGYVPDQRAQSMRSSGMKTVGLLVPDLRNPYFADLVSSMENRLYSHGVSTLIGTSAESVERQDVFIANLLGQRIDGVIVVPQGVETPGVCALVSADLPVVFVDRRIEGLDSVPFVVSDPVPGTRAAVKELVRLGHRRIGYVSHPSLGSSSINERATAFLSIAKELLPDGHSVIVECASTYASRRAALDNLLAADVTAIICAYSPDMITLIGLLYDRGIEIGSGMSVISFDDIDEFTLMTPPVSVISQQAQNMGSLGVDMLLERMAEPHANHDNGVRYVPTEFIARQSIGAVA